MCTEMLSFRESVNMSCEGFVTGFRLICSALYSDLIWVRELTLYVCLTDIFLSAPADHNFGLEAQYFQRFCQDCHKCKCESLRLIIVRWFDMLIFVIKVDLRSRLTSHEVKVIRTSTIVHAVWTFRPLLCDDLLI